MTAPSNVSSVGRRENQRKELSQEAETPTTPLASPNTLQPLLQHSQAGKGPGGQKDAPHRCPRPGGARRVPRHEPQRGPGPQPSRAQHTRPGAPRPPRRGAPVPEPASPAPGPAALRPSRPGPQPSPQARPNCLPGSSPPAPEGRRTLAAASSLPSKVKSSKSGLRQRL